MLAEVTILRDVLTQALAAQASEEQPDDATQPRCNATQECNSCCDGSAASDQVKGTPVTVAPRVSVDKVSKAFAIDLRAVDVARDAWVSTTSDGYDLWLLTQPIDLVAERDLYALVDRMYERFPSSRFSLHILNTETFVDLVPESIVPSQARHVGLRASA